MGPYKSLFDLMDFNGSLCVVISPYASLCVILGAGRSVCDLDGP